MTQLDWTDIQGIVLRGYSMPLVRNFVLHISSPVAARRFVGTLVQPNTDIGITTAQPWLSTPEACLNIGFTFSGLEALGLSPASLASFPKEFADGAAAKANELGFTGKSAPVHWRAKLNTTDAHMVLFLFAREPAGISRWTEKLRALGQGGLTELDSLDGQALPDGTVHFGYRDGISQPRIEGSPAEDWPDAQPLAPAGEFLLGYPSQWRDFSYPVPTPLELGRNGSFAVFGILQQEVAAFHMFLRRQAMDLGLSEEMIAAKMCGRWRNGVPLALSPDTDQPNPPIPRERLNDFDYIPSADHPGIFDDRRGQRCPKGAHIRTREPPWFKHSRW